MNLVISAITIVDLTNKEAKHITFSPNKNLITSGQNHLGKSVIMKSIYYTLGAEVFYPYPIKKLNLLTYIDFLLDSHSYRVARLKNTFVLYRDESFCRYFSSTSEFEDGLGELFGLEINLVSKNQEGTIVKCPPAYYYMPFYVDQENGWAANSFSFDRMTQFDLPQRKSSYFFHLGVYDSGFVQISKRQKTNGRKITTLTKENEKYKTVIDTLQAGINAVQMSFDTSSLERAIAQRQQEIKKVLDNLSKVRSELIETEDQLVQLTHEKELLSKYIKKKTPQTESTIYEAIECPRCGMIFEQTITQRLEKAYLLESLHDDYTTISDRKNLLEKQAARLRHKFCNMQQMLSDYESSLETDRESYNTYVKSKATNQLLKEYWEQIGHNTAEIDRLRKDSAEIHKQLSLYAQEKEKVNTSYLSNLGKLFEGLDIPSDQIDENSEPGSALVASGAYGPRCKVAQMLAFIETQNAVAPEQISFPIVIDSPNVLEQDSDHLNAVLRTLLTWDKTSNQIIVASIEGKNIAMAIEGVNIITLTNSKNHLLNSAEYIAQEDEIAEIFTRF